MFVPPVSMRFDSEDRISTLSVNENGKLFSCILSMIFGKEFPGKLKQSAWKQKGVKKKRTSFRKQDTKNQSLPFYGEKKERV